MKKNSFPILAVIVLIILGVGLVLIQTNRDSRTTEIESGNNNDEQTVTNVFHEEPDLCISINRATVESLLGKTITKTESLMGNDFKSCQYYLDDTHALVLNYDQSSVETKIKGHKFLERTITENTNIPM